jgi:hypothetical protein
MFDSNTKLYSQARIYMSKTQIANGYNFRAREAVFEGSMLKRVFFYHVIRREKKNDKMQGD